MRLLIVENKLAIVYLLLNQYDEVLRVGINQRPENKNKQDKYELIMNHPYCRLIEAYWAGDDKALDKIKVKLEGSLFQLAVWRMMRQVSFGQTISYSALATMAGYPRAVRAVGTACKTNPCPLIIPCHRVIRADGQLGQYALGAELKQVLLAHEGYHKLAK